MPDAAREPRSRSHRKVLSIACFVLAIGIAIAMWPATEPPASFAQTAGPRAAEPATPVSEPLAPAPETPRREIIAAPDAGSRTDDDASTVRIEFDTFDTWATGRPTTTANFGPIDGAAELNHTQALTVRVHAPSQEWLIHEGLLRRVRSNVGQTLRVPLGEYVHPPWLGENRWRMTDVDLPWLGKPSALAHASFSELPDQADGGATVVGGGRAAPTFQLNVDVLAPDRSRANDASVFVTSTSTGTTRPARRMDHTFDAGRLTAGSWVVCAAGRQGGRAQRVVDLATDTTVELVLQRGPEVRGRVVDRDAKPVARSRILWIGGGEYRNQVMTSDDGTFVVHDVGGAGTVWACVPGERSQLPAVGRIVAPGEAIELVLDRAHCRSSLRVRVGLPQGVEPGDVCLRLWQQDSEHGVRLIRAKTGDGVVELGRDEVPAGHYRLEVHCPGFGVTDAGMHWIDGTGAVALDVALPAPAHVTFALPAGTPAPAADAFELVRVGAAVDIVIPSKTPLRGPHVLGPGRYAVWWRDASGVRSRAFTVTTSGPQTVDLAN